MRVRDLMTTDVVTIGPEAPLRDVAGILSERGISGLPVCDIERQVLGVVSEADILHKQRGAREPGGQLRWLVEGIPDAAGVAKAAARTAGEAMTSPAVTIAPYDSTSAAARIMSERGINRLPVVEEGKLVGIVTRADLVRAFTRTDAELEAEIRDDVLGRTMWVDEGSVDVEVTDGVVSLRGRLDRRSDAELLELLAARVPGVVSLESSVTWRLDDASRRGRRKLERTAG